MKNKHLTLSERQDIEQHLNQGASFHSLAALLGRSPTTISNEVKARALHHQANVPYRVPNACRLRHHCHHSELCVDCPYKKKRYNCRFCKHCNQVCLDFDPEICHKLSEPPYVCNPCPEKQKCTLGRITYQAKHAHNSYTTSWSEDRQGFYLTGLEMERISELVTPRLKQGHSLYSIYQEIRDKIPCSISTTYQLIEQGELKATNFDLPRKISFKTPKKKRPHKVDRQCHVGRSFDDYKQFLTEEEPPHIVQMDSIKGKQGGPVLLSLGWPQHSLIRLHWRAYNDAHSVVEIFNWYERTLGLERFRALFPVLLGDRGSEFSDPTAIEFSPYTGERRTYVFYCDPRRADQKGFLERMHADVRRIFPKGIDFSQYTQEMVDLACDHLNSYPRKKLIDKTPLESFSFFLSDEIPTIMGWETIPLAEIYLTPDYFKTK